MIWELYQTTLLNMQANWKTMHHINNPITGRICKCRANGIFNCFMENNWQVKSKLPAFPLDSSKHRAATSASGFPESGSETLSEMV